jgi:isopenicillin N synthase-like dioxygenase
MKIKVFLLALSLNFLSYTQEKNEPLPSSIPVIDMQLYKDPATKEKFIEAFADALHEIGFCAIINTGLDEQALYEGYRASISFFKHPLEKKMETLIPSLSAQRGFVLSENAQGHLHKDAKEFYHIGYSHNVWPSWMDLKTPMEKLIAVLDEHSFTLQEALSLFMGQEKDFLWKMTEKGDSLLRALYYPKNTEPSLFWAAEHTDIDLFTILPMATEDGLQIFHNGEWLNVRVPSNAFIINCGDMLQNMSNGYFKSSVHRVVSQKDKERFSIVYFVHPRDEDRLDPLAHCVTLTNGIETYPKADHKEMLAHRLLEIGVASKELKDFALHSGYIERVEALVQSGKASDAVIKTYNVWQKIKEAK